MKWQFIFDKETANFLVHVLHKHLSPVQWSVALRDTDVMYLRNTVYLTLEQPLGCGVISTQSSTHAQVRSNTWDNSGTSLLWLHICRRRMDCTTHVQGPVVDPGFPGEGGVNPAVEGANLCLVIFPKNCMELKKIYIEGMTSVPPLWIWQWGRCTERVGPKTQWLWE